MGGLALLVEHWGYAAIFAIIVLGNVGLPVPEETVLTLARYLVWRGDLRLWLVLIVGVASASVGDNVGYWLGRRLGGPALRRYGTRVWLSPAKVDATQRFVQEAWRLGSLCRQVRAGASLRSRTRRGYHRHARPCLPHREHARRLLLRARHGRNRLCARTWSRTPSRTGFYSGRR